MKYYIGTNSEELRKYLKEEFGGFQECHGVLAPPAGTVIDIVEPLQTCHRIGEGLDYKCIPICTLIVGKLIPGVLSHFMVATIIPNEVIRFEAGYSYQNCIDWRATVKHKSKIG